MSKYEFADLSLDRGCVAGGFTEECANCCAVRMIRRTTGTRNDKGKLTPIAKACKKVLNKNKNEFSGVVIPDFHWRNKLSKTDRAQPKKFMCSYQTDISLTTPEQLAELLVEIHNHPKDEFYMLTKAPLTLFTKIQLAQSIIGIDLKKLTNIRACTSVGMDKYKFRIEQLRKFSMFGFELHLFLKPLIARINNPDLTGISMVRLAAEKGKIHRPCEQEWVDHIVEQAKKQGVRYQID